MSTRTILWLFSLALGVGGGLLMLANGVSPLALIGLLVLLWGFNISNHVS